MNSLLFSFTLLASLASFSAQAQTPSFSIRDSLGRLASYKDKTGTHYLGYFCLERSKESDHKCLQSQFGRGEEQILGVDFMGNASDSLGSWTSVGPVFSTESGLSFYNAALQGKSKEAFLEVWQTVWTREGYNWSSTPAAVSKSSIEAFVGLLGGNPSEPASVTEPMTYKQIKKALKDNRWTFEPWDGYLDIDTDGSKLKFCLTIDADSHYSNEPNYEFKSMGGFGGSGYCFNENAHTLSYDADTQTFSGIGVDRNPISFSITKKNGLISIQIKMTAPPGSIYVKSDDHKRYYYYAEQKIDQMMIRKW
jgi:hypothetical protein